MNVKPPNPTITPDYNNAKGAKVKGERIKDKGNKTGKPGGQEAGKQLGLLAGFTELGGFHFIN